MLPKISHYYRRPTGRLSETATLVEIGNLSIWFSYQTPVAFQVGGHPRVISNNYWGSATGAHINAIDSDKSRRIGGTEFESRLKDVVATVDDVLEGALL